MLALAIVTMALAWWTHGFRAFTTDGAALAAAGPMPRTAPTLSFVRSTGEQGSMAELHGRYALLTFMYLHCPDVCHLVTARLQRGYQKLDDLIPGQLVLVSLSLDPERDSTAILDDHWRMLGGKPGWIVGRVEGENAAVDAALASLGAWITRLPDGRINHAASSFLLDPDGRVIEVFRPEMDADALVSALRSRLR